MPTSQRSSVFQTVTKREVLASKVYQKPSVKGMTSMGGMCGCGVLEMENNGVTVPPLAITFGKGYYNGHLLVVADEEGFLSIFNTCKRLPSLANCHRQTETVRIGRLLAHNNAIFDLCWLQDGSHLLTASGDQTIKVWDMNLQADVGTMIGHNGSVKSLSAHPFHEGQFVSGSRDGNVAIWDIRSPGVSKYSGSESSVRPIAWIKDAHVFPRKRKQQLNKGITKSVTAVVYLKDGRLLATAGAADGKVKFWDIRNLQEPVCQSFPGEAGLQTGTEGRRAHGIASLSQDPCGRFLIASCTDNKIYMYDLAQPEHCHRIFSGNVVGSFYVKAVFSPDGTHILSGSTDGNVFIWQVDQVDDSPIVLSGHKGEVTAVDWSAADFCKLATCSDDHTVRVWSIKDSCFTQKRWPSIIQSYTNTLPCNKRLVAPSMDSLGKYESMDELSNSVKCPPGHEDESFDESGQPRKQQDWVTSDFNMLKKQRSIAHYFPSSDM